MRAINRAAIDSDRKYPAAEQYVESDAAKSELIYLRRCSLILHHTTVGSVFAFKRELNRAMYVREVSGPELEYRRTREAERLLYSQTVQPPGGPRVPHRDGNENQQSLAGRGPARLKCLTLVSIPSPSDMNSCYALCALHLSYRERSARTAPGEGLNGYLATLIPPHPNPLPMGEGAMSIDRGGIPPPLG